MADDATAGAPAAYRVLARKYRPATFAELIGQDAMVRTLTNAFAAGRIAQAYLLTGVRGVGKTTTARLLARAFNYEREGEDTGPRIDLSEPGIHCAAIMESRHPDVFEMDAASNTGIDDIREIIGYAQTRPSMARTKVFIIDEVHMLSRQAFNGLLKTLEEPPEHARFIFATTEVRKVPVTVLSRCQRFDLRRVEADKLIAHFGEIAEKEGAKADPEALALIARASEGSVRDGLSLLDQAIALGQGTVGEADARAMLGLADRGRVIDLFEAAMRGDAAGALAELDDQAEAGADPQVLLGDLAEFVHLVTRAKLAPEALADPALSEAERERARSLSETLGMGVLSRAWQMLLKGLEEVAEAARPQAAADMVLARMAFAVELPPPDEAIRQLGETDQPATPDPSADTAPRREPAPGPAAVRPAPKGFDEAAQLIGDLDIRLVDVLERTVRPVSFEPGRIEIALTEEAPPDLAGRLSATLQRATGAQWVVSIVSDGGGATLREARASAEEERRREVAELPLVREVMERFPGAEVVAVRDLPPPPEAPGAAEAEEEAEGRLERGAEG